MESPILKISVWIIEILSWVLLLLSLLFCFKRGAPAYMKTFPLYTAVNCIPEIACFVWPNLSALVIFIFTLFELAYFTYFLSQIIQSKRTIRNLCVTNAIVGVVTIIELFTEPLRKVNGRLDLAESFILVTAALCYFRELFRAPKYIDLLKNSAFWMATGILFYFVLLVPTVIFTSYFYYYGNKVTGQAIYSLNSYSQIISYALYVKAMTCRQKLS